MYHGRWLKKKKKGAACHVRRAAMGASVSAVVAFSSRLAGPYSASSRGRDMSVSMRDIVQCAFLRHFLCRSHTIVWWCGSGRQRFRCTQQAPPFLFIQRPCMYVGALADIYHPPRLGAWHPRGEGQTELSLKFQLFLWYTTM